MPNAIIEHIAASVGEPYDKNNLGLYDISQVRRKHLSAVRNFLNVNPFGNDGKSLMRQTFAEAALTKEDVIDIVNIGIETLVRHRYELPALFNTLVREAQRLARATDDLCDIFCKQMRRVLHCAEGALEKYLKDNQEKTDEILRRFALLETVLNFIKSNSEQLDSIRYTVMNRLDLCEFSRLHAEYGGKNPFRFVRHFFKPRRAALLRILSK